MNLPSFRVLVTRPKAQGEQLSAELHAAGFETFLLPLIEIKALSDYAPLIEHITQLDHYDWAIFISRSAVQMSQAFLHKQWPQFSILKLQLAAVGQGTAEALKEAQLPEAIYPDSAWSSEGLLALAAFQKVKG